MALVQGTGAGGGGTQKKKKKKRKDSGSPGSYPGAGSQPLEDATRKLAKGYFKRTGKLPSAEKTTVLAQAAAKDPTVVSQADFDDLFPDWVKGVEDPDDVSVTDFITSPSKRSFKERVERAKRLPKWTKHELATLPFKNKTADETRALANTAIHGESMSSGEIADINTARDWYLGTDLKKRITKNIARREAEAAQAELSGEGGGGESSGGKGGGSVVQIANATNDGFYKTDGSVNIKGIKNWAKQNGTRSGTLMDPSVWASLRESLEGKDREDLTRSQLDDLDALAVRLSTVYPGFAKHYDKDINNVQFDGYFNERFEKYVVEANIGYAMGLCVHDEDGKLAQRARKNIEIATRGVIDADSDIHEMLSFLGSTGDPDNPDSRSEELASYIFDGYYNARATKVGGEWSDRRVLRSYVHDFGVNALPSKYYDQYQEENTVWDKSLKALRQQTDDSGDTTSAADAFHLSLADQLPDGHEDFVEDLEPEAEPEAARSPHTGKGQPMTQYHAPSDYESWIDTTLIPAVEDYVLSPALAGLNYYEKMKNRIFLSAAIDASRNFEQQGAHGGGRGHGSLGEKADELVKLPDSYKEGTAWSVAERLTSAGDAGDRAYMREVWRTNGWDPDEHPILFSAADLAWSMGTDMLLDAGIGAIGGLTRNAAASVGRKMLSPKLAKKVADAEQALADTATAVNRESGVLKQGRQTGRGAARVAAGTGEVSDAAALAEAGDKLARAKETINLLRRPLWYDTTAIALAKSTQDAHQVARFLNVSDAAMDGTTRSGMMKILSDIGKSRDADDVLELMNKLSMAPYAQRIENGASLYGKTLRYARIMNGDKLAAARETVEGERRLSHGLDSVQDMISKYGTLSRMGHANTAAGRKKAAEEVNGFLRRWADIGGETLEDVNLAKRELMQDMWDTIERNMTAEAASARDIKKIALWAKRAGVELEDGWDANAWTMFKAFQKVGQKGEGKRAQKRTTAYAEEAAADAAGMAEKGRNLPAYEFQLAKDVVFPLNPQKLIAFQRGDVLGGLTTGAAWELRQTSPFLNVPFTGLSVKGLSPDMVTNWYKQLVIGNPMFVLRVVGIDEFWRPEYQEAMWKRVLGKLSKNKRATEAEFADVLNDEAQRVIDGNLSLLKGRSDSWEYQSPDMLDATFNKSGHQRRFVNSLNGYNEAMSKETSTNLLAAIPRKEGESVDDYAERFRDALTDLAVGRRGEALSHLSDEQYEAVSANFRLKLQEMGRDWRGTPDGKFMSPEDVAAANEPNAAKLEQSWDDIAEAEADRDALKAERQDIVEAITGERSSSVRFGAPGKKFTASWLRHEHPGEIEVNVDIPTEKVKALLRERDALMAAHYEASLSGGYASDSDLLAYIRKRGGIKRDETFWDSTITAAENRRMWHGLDRVRGGVSMDELAAELAQDPEFSHFGISDTDSLWEWLRGVDTTAAKKTPKRALDKAEKRVEEIEAILGRGQTRGLTDDEVLSAFHSDLASQDVRTRLADAYQDGLMRKRGYEREWSRYKEIDAEMDAAKSRLRAAKTTRNEAQKAGTLRVEPGSSMEQWISYTAEHAKAFMHDDELFDAFLTGKKLSRKQLMSIRSRLQEQGLDLPRILAVKASPDWGAGSIPGLTWFNSVTTNKLMDKVSNGMSRTVFMDHLVKEHDRLVSLGIDTEQAWRRAGSYAQAQAERILYKHAATPIENAGRNIALFLPAYRQAAVYWAKVLARHPVLMSNMRSRFGSDYNMMRIGDYQFSVPTPFWMSSDLSEIGIPGAGPMIVMPIRAANTWSGYTKGEDGKYTYTGATDLDSIADIAPLSFVNKSASPLSWVDDLLYGIMGDDMYLNSEDTSLGGAVLGGALNSLFRDKQKRAKLAVNIANAQISRGIKPDYGKALEEMRDKPFWQDVVDALVEPLGGQSEGVLAAASKMFFIGRVSYKPADLGPTKDKLNIWQRLFGKEAISMSDARYEYQQAAGHPAKMKAILDKYPNFKAVIDYYDMNARERVEYLSDPAHLWLLPYVQGRSNYDNNGYDLTGAEYWEDAKSGAIYAKSIDEYWATKDDDGNLVGGLEYTWKNLGWLQTAKQLKSDYTKDKAAAHKWAVGVANKLARSPEHRERLLSDLKYYEKGWTDENPAKDQYSEGKKPSAPDWLELAAKQAGIYEDPFKWSVYAVQLRYDQSLKSLTSDPVALSSYGFQGAKAKLKGKKPEDAETGGLEQVYTNDAAYGYNWEENMGMALKVTDELYKLASPEYKALFDKRRSVSWPTINETMQTKESYRDYASLKTASTEYWKLSNVAETMEALGCKNVNRDGLNRAAVAADVAYQDYLVATKGLDTWDDKYQQVRNAYRAKLDKIFSSDAAAPLRNGPAGRLLNTYLVQPGTGLKVNRNYVSHVVAQMQKNGVNAATLAASYRTRGDIPASKAARVRTATAWAALLSTAIVYRNTMKKGHSEDGAWRGISVSSDAGKAYANRLKKLAAAWSRTDDEFRKEYKSMGGDDCIEDWLDALF